MEKTNNQVDLPNKRVRVTPQEKLDSLKNWFHSIKKFVYVCVCVCVRVRARVKGSAMDDETEDLKRESKRIAVRNGKRKKIESACVCVCV